MFPRATAVTGFSFGLVSRTDGTAVTSGTTTGYVTKDGGTQAALGGTIVHEGNGQWSIDTISAAEMTADIVGLLFTNTSAVPVQFTIRTTPTDGLTVDVLTDDALDQIVAAFAGSVISIGSGDSELTLESAASSYLSVAELKKRIDYRVLADLCSDTGTRLTEAALLTNENLAALLADASAEFERACMCGERYKPADLAALVAASTVAKSGVFRILSRLVMVMAYERRPDKGPVPEVYMKVLDELERLRHGERILQFTEAANAGHSNYDVENTTDVETRNGIPYQARRVFGRRSDRDPANDDD